jgi:large subunit ribosomal protein L25
MGAPKGAGNRCEISAKDSKAKAIAEKHRDVKLPQRAPEYRLGMSVETGTSRETLKNHNTMKIIQIKGEKRTGFGKKNSKDVRRDGRIPVILYGGKGEPVDFSVDAKEMRPLIYSPNSFIVEFDIDGKKEKGVLREVQFHPVKDHPLHIDFFRLSEGQPVAIDIPVRITGNSEGVKLGGKLTVMKRKLRVSGLEQNLPDELVVDVTELGIGKSIFVGDLKYDNLTLLNPSSTAVCAVIITRAARGAAAAAAEE